MQTETKPLINPDNGHQIRRHNGQGNTAYFQGGNEDYGRYAWNIKYHKWESEYEIEAARDWAFGEWVDRKGVRGFEALSELLGRPIESSMEGRSGGWLVIDSELSKPELRKVDRFIARIMKQLPNFLKEERDFHREQKEAAEQDEAARRTALAKDSRVKEACALIRSIAGQDAVLTLQGIGIDLETGKPLEGRDDA